MKNRRKTTRRRFLRGAGAAIALPMLPSLSPGRALAQLPEADGPRRFVTLFFPNGTDQHNEWNISGPAGSRAYQLGTCHASLAPMRDKFSMLNNINNEQVGGPPPGHGRATAAFLTGQAISDRDLARVGISIDQVIAGSLLGTTPLGSLELGPNPYGSVPVDSGWSTAYNANLSWSSDSVFNTPANDPAAVFDALFGEVLAGPQAANARRRRRRSILDYVRGEASSIQGRINPRDRHKLDEYLTAIREVELLIEGPVAADLACDPGSRPAGSALPHTDPMAFPQHTRIMMDLLVLALQCDMTRVITYMLDLGFGRKNFSFLVGTHSAHHDITHTNTSEAHLIHQQITTWYCDQLAYLLQRMDSIDEGSGTLLDNSMVLFGSGLGDGRTHQGQSMPLILAGGGAGTLDPGRIIYPGGSDKSHTRLLLTLAQKMGVDIDTFAGATQPLDRL